jgi:hypothetical protein
MAQIKILSTPTAALVFADTLMVAWPVREPAPIVCGVIVAVTPAWMLWSPSLISPLGYLGFTVKTDVLAAPPCATVRVVGSSVSAIRGGGGVPPSTEATTFVVASATPVAVPRTTSV